MRKQIDLNENWLFHKGDIKVPRPTDKGPTYTQSKTVRKLIGPGHTVITTNRIPMIWTAVYVVRAGST